MNRQIITLLLVAIFTNFGYSQSEKINIKTEHLTEANYLKIDDFYLTHYLYIDLFLRENLFPEASPEDVSSILKALKKYVSVENKLDVEIEKPGKRNYLIRFAILKKDDGTELLIAFTNWTVKKKAFEKEIKMENDSYTRWYFLNGNKMTYRKDMSDQNDYSTMNKSDLANAYLFDELSENDSEIESTINEYLNQSDISISDKIMANLILLKYQIFKKENDNVTKQTEYLTELFEQNKSETNLRGLQAAFNATKFQMELSK
ncbi:MULTISPECIES: hypothetical protein [Mesonia]|uniref:Uncharacterized protein n=1 Tax=Mesonia oceanica TaxID=2687242 RepID=A0AC61YDE2_9FLAO|nr:MULTISPECIES: hypothetical protein [Mesonia]MAN27677.1 hypothetical protein [Mesonia sp.]MAQ40733.1 hypothetical protein [Mesonia sp.]MBJ98849.1 hypothetical protein [Flavobacteriaceae bacterium]VVV02537.1 hypothetical protein FVB9532_03837 [Mesonia oceanica]|tara:strand:+ start:787 stop:1569 length:783 start_codon:yes stop_codon:yes gene_type:complete